MACNPPAIRLATTANRQIQTRFRTSFGPDTITAKNMATGGSRASAAFQVASGVTLIGTQLSDTLTSRWAKAMSSCPGSRVQIAGGSGMSCTSGRASANPSKLKENLCWGTRPGRSASALPARISRGKAASSTSARRKAFNWLAPPNAKAKTSKTYAAIATRPCWLLKTSEITRYLREPG